jgi:hypothetical protein
LEENEEAGMADPWAEAAERLGLSHRRGGMMKEARLEGTIDGVPVRVATRSDATPDADQGPTTEYVVGFEDAGLGLSAKRLGKVGRLLGRRRIETGDEAFDAEVAAGGGDPERIRGHLTAPRRAAILELLERYPGAKITDDRIRFVSPLGIDTGHRLDTTVQDLVGYARTLWM